MASPAPLDGKIVLDFSTVGPAARCARILADYGATVVKVGAPPRKGALQIEPPYYAYSAHRGMKRIRCDLKAPAGREAFLRLATTADVVIESFRPGVVDRLGVGYEEVSRRNPGIVYCSTSGYGQDGPRAAWAGHDLNYLAVGGFLDCSGRRGDGGPPLPGATIADSAGGGMHAALAILAALVHRAACGEGQYLDVSVADGVLWFMSLAVDQYLATGEEPGPGHDILTGRFACYDVYATRDEKWLAVAAIEPAFWANLCRALDLEQWIPHQTDDVQQEAIRADLRRVLASRERDEWVAELASADTCVAPVQSIAELTRDAQFVFRGAFHEARHENRGAFRQVAPVLAGSPRDDAPGMVRDASATDTGEVLADAGFTGDEIQKLRDEGVVS